MMDISGTSSFNAQPTTLQRNDPNASTASQQAIENQQRAQSVDPVTTQQPVQKSTQLNEDLVNARVSEHQALSSGKQVTADEAVGSLVDVRV